MEKAMIKEENRIHQYISKNVRGRRQKVGIMVAAIDTSGCIRMGWSKVNTSAGDSFSRKTALALASERLKANELVPIPHSITKDMYGFAARCGRYYKDAREQYQIRVQR